MAVIKRIIKTVTSVQNFPYLFLSLLLVIYFFPIFFQNQTFYYGDILSVLPLKKFFFDSLAKGVFPLWLPDMLSGYPIFADLSAGTYYLPYLFLVIAQTIRAISILVVIHFFIAAFFMYRLCRHLRISKTGSLSGAIIYSLSGLMVNYIADPSRFFVVSLYPVFFLFLVKSLEKKNFLILFLTSAVLATQIFAGHIQYVVIELLFVPVFLFQKTEKKFSKKLLSLLIIIILGFLFAAVVILPTLELMPYSTRSLIGQDLSVYRNFSLHPLSLVRFILAHFWGIRNEGSAWGFMDTSTLGYIGFVPLLLILLNIKQIFSVRRIWPFLFAAVLSLFISFGTNLSFFKFFISTIPIFGVFRNPMSFLVVYTFSLSLISGFAVDFFITQKLRFKKTLIILLFFVVAAAVFFIAVNINRSIPQNLLKMTASLFHKNLSAFHTIEVDKRIAGFITLNIAAVSILGFVSLIISKREMIPLIIFLDLLLFTKSNLFILDASLVETRNPVVNFLQQNLGSYRYLSSSEILPFSGMYDYFGRLAFQPPFSKEGSQLDKQGLEEQFTNQLRLIPPNFSYYYNLKTIDGIATFILKDYNRMFQKNSRLNRFYESAGKYNPQLLETKADAVLTKIDFTKIDFNDSLLDELSVKSLVSDRELYLSHHRRVYFDKGISVYENINVKPRAYITDDSGKMTEVAEILKEDANTVKILAGKKGLLVLKDIYYPGWKVFVNGKENKLQIVDGLWRGIRVEEEGSLVTFSFQPRSFYLGLAVSGLSLISAIIYLLLNNTNLFKKVTLSSRPTPT